ncbi:MULTISPECIES: hypothetical protein [unclassified Arthrobacter]|uniref:hypothetical protein n=1 Tax=unclassified Arthrobacter TaxID=235627 RepID=UPI0014917D05|nr:MULTISPECIES: hypothetical protein [unclassified Arthrobacter]MBE0009574.1 hypothetical protein [Arthrobacter sp. AET 35A]NOJ63324.1 hypothetical protein [Arthrobacter sp. 147(2020)]
MSLVHFALTKPDASVPSEIELSVAAIGLLGVLLGGLLQILFQLRRDRASARDQIRQTVLDGITQTIRALAVLYELASTGQARFAGPGGIAPTVVPPASPETSKSEKAKTAHAEADAALGRCAAISDRRVALQAQDIRYELVSLFSTYVNHFNAGTLDDETFSKFDARKEDAAFSVSVLHTMIEPRWYERRPTFRSYKRSRRIALKEKVRFDSKAIAGDPTPTKKPGFRQRIPAALRVLLGKSPIGDSSTD